MQGLRVGLATSPASCPRYGSSGSRRTLSRSGSITTTRPAAIAADVTGDLRPYRLRGSFVSLLLWEGRSLTYVAEQAGHSVATLAKHYAGVFRELEHQPRVSAAEAIRGARERVRVATELRQSDEGGLVTVVRLACKCDRWTMLGSNQRPPPCRGGALPAELIVRGGVTVARADGPERLSPAREGSAAGCGFWRSRAPLECLNWLLWPGSCEVPVSQM